MREFDYSRRPGKVHLQRGVMNSGAPLVSIITPFYNAGQYFMETVNCILNQTFPYFEWIIVNDGSTRNEDVTLLAQIEKLDSRIIIEHKENGGPSSARNLAIDKSRTEIIIPLDADDLIEPTYCECVYWSLYINPTASWSYTDSVGFFEEEYLWKKPFNAKQMKKENILTYAAGIRKKDLLDIGLQSEQQKYLFEDWHQWLKLLSKGKHAVHMNWYGFWYRRTDMGVLSQITRDKELKKKSDRVIAEVAKTVDDKVDFIEYPRYKISSFQKPQIWSWDRPPIFNNPKINVLLLLPHMVMGGADLFNLDVVSRINKNQFEMSIISTNPADSTWRQRFEEHVTDIFDLTTFLDMNHWMSFIHYFIRSRSIDILFISNSYYGYYLIPWLRKEFPDLVILDYVHSETWYWRAGGYARTSGAMGNILEKTYVCSNHLRQVMIDSFKKDPTSVETLYIGVDEKDYDCTVVHARQVRLQLGLNDEQPLLLFPCRIDVEKRPFLMLEIAKALRGKIHNLAVVVVGDGPQLEELQEKIRNMGLESTVYCVGRQKDMRPYYRDSDITLICSLKEGISLTSYESLAMGVPVVSSDVGGQKELIDQEVGQIIPLYQDETLDLNSRQFPQQEIDHYVIALMDILTLSDNERAELRKACRNRIVKDFTKDQMINQLENELYAWKNGRGQEKRRNVSNAIQLLPDLVDDYLALYSEFEINQIHSNRAIQLLEYMKAIVRMQKSPLVILKDFRRLNNRYFIQRYIATFKATRLGRVLSYAKKLLP
jgi:glycosyltransferase involved in cell wall biosynthesis